MTASSRESIVLHAPANGDSLEKLLIRINRIDLEAPWQWIGAGWADLKRMPLISLAYGAIFALVAAGMLYGLTLAGWQSMILPLAGGFFLIGPVLAAGLYEGSRRLQAGEPVNARGILLAGFKAPGQLALLGLVLMLIFLAWVETAFLLFMMYFGDKPFPPLEEFVPRLLFTWRGLALLITGTLEGAALAALVFVISAISAPMLMARPVGIATAILTSVRAAWFNFWPMALWAVLIAGFMIAGIATLFVGLIVAFPLIGHATWHAYRDITADG